MKRNVGIFVATSLITSTTLVHADRSGGWAPLPDEIKWIERTITMPVGSYPINEYARYYWGDTVNGDTEGSAFWIRVTKALEEMERKAPRDGEVFN